MQTLLNRTLQFLGALLPRVAYGVLVGAYTVWLILRQFTAWTRHGIGKLAGKLVHYP